MNPSRLADTLPASYRVCGAVVVSDIEFPELEPAPRRADEPAIRLRLGRINDAAAVALHGYRSSPLALGETALECTKSPHGYRLRFADLAEFHVDQEGSEVLCAFKPGLDPHTARHLILDQLMPVILALRGQESLHATAILTPGGVCAFVGASGAGKSTLAASFAFEGFPVVSDDCLVIRAVGDGILATPAYPGVRLCEDAVEEMVGSGPSVEPVAHYSAKQRIGTSGARLGFAEREASLIRIYALDSPEDGAEGPETPALEAITPRECFMTLVRSSFRLDFAGRAILARQFSFNEQVVARVRIKRLRYRRQFSGLPAVRRTILADLS